jgi:imidazolonepropionase-like amidohydrolase
MQNIGVRLCIATLVVLAGGCAATTRVDAWVEAAEPVAQPRNLNFTTTEFTRPYIEVSPDGREFYFDALGEIYRVPVQGGQAIRVALGAGWKTMPVMSDDGRWLVHASDADDTRENLQFWGKRLGTGDAPRQLGVLWRAREGSSPQGAPAYVYPGLQQRWNVATGTFEETRFGLKGYKGQFRMSRDGETVGYEMLRDGASVLAVHEPETGATAVTGCVLERTVSTLYAPTFAFMPDGASVLLSRGGKFHRCWFDGRSVEVPVSAAIDKTMMPMAMPRSTPQQRTQIRYPELDLEGRRLFFTAKGKVWQSELPGGSPARLTSGDAEELMPALSSDGARIAYVVQDGRAVSLRVRELATGRERVVLDSENVAYANPAWSLDGSRLVFVEVRQLEQRSGPGNTCCAIKYVDVVTGDVRVIGPGPSKPLNGSEMYPRPTWSATGDALYYTREVWFPGGGTVDRIALVRHPLDGEPVVMLTMQPAIQDAVISPDGAQVALRDRLGVSILGLGNSVVDGDAPPRHVSLHESRNLRRLWLDGPDYLAWTPDGRLRWSIQDEVFVGTGPDNTERLARITLPANPNATEGVRVYLGGRIVSMGAAGTIEQGAIVTEGSRIRYVGESAKLPREFAALQPIDIRGKTVIPGLVDVHRHTLPGQDDFATQRNFPLFTDLAYGVTTIYDPSIHTVKSAYLTDLSRDDSFLGPTVYGSGNPLLDDDHNGSYAYIGGLADARGYVGRAAKAGVPLVKAYLRRTREDRRLIVQAAREAGIGVVSHEDNVIHTQLSQVQDGYTAIEHTLLLGSAPFYADVIEYLKRSGVMLTPSVADENSNLVGSTMWKRTSRDDRFTCLIDTEKQRRSWERIDRHGKPQRRGPDGQPEIPVSLIQHIREYAALLNAGVPLSIGAHTLPAGVGTHWDMWALAQGGATPMNVLKAATVNGAYKLGMQDRIGSLAEGMDADFVILNANPLDDIHNTTDIARVVRRGRTVQWPEGEKWPQSWPGEGDWSACKARNLGIPAMDTSTAPKH